MLIMDFCKKLVFCVMSWLLVSSEALSSGYRGDFVQAFDHAWMVAFGTVRRVDIDWPIVGQLKKEVRYRLHIQKIYKGQWHEPTVMFYDLHYCTTAGLRIEDKSQCLIFLRNPIVRQTRWWNPLGKENNIIACFRASRLTSEEIKALDPAISLLREYRQMRTANDQKAFLLGQLGNGNPLLSSFVVREIQGKKIMEAIPFFEKELQSSSQAMQIFSAYQLSALDYPQLGDYLIRWLDDPQWHGGIPSWNRKPELVQLLVKSKKRDAVPTLRKLVFSDNESLAVKARVALLRLGEADARHLLFDLINTSSNSASRYDAVFALGHPYQGPFSPEEKASLQSLRDDKDVMVRQEVEYLFKEIDAQSSTSTNQ